MSLRKVAVKGFFWVAVERFGQQIFQFIVFIVLARLLEPESFGVIAIVLVVISISQTLVDSGMGQALIREKVISDRDRSTVFWFNLFLSLIVYAALFFLSPFLAAFFESPELKGGFYLNRL